MPTPWVAGVASGISIHTGIPVYVIRILFIVSFITLFAAGLIAYLLFVALLPLDAGQNTAGQRGAQALTAVGESRREATSRNQMMMAGFSLVGISVLLLLVMQTDGLSLRTVFSGILVLAGLTLSWVQASHTGQWRSLKFWLYLSAGLFLVLSGTTIYLAGSGATGELIRGALFGGGVILIVLVTLAPLWVRMSRQLSHAQEEKVRETERADIAAHLHDSVLQTLTLIRGSAENPAKVRALALSQERELRSWLYTGQSEAASSTAEALREAATQVEATYGMAIDVVTVGDLTPGPNELALVAAAAEALKNAVRHGAPPVSVFMEITAEKVNIYVKDRGPGFDLTSIPDDRHGVRGSIIGRVERVGGSAILRRLDPGIEVQLSVPRSEAASIRLIPLPAEGLPNPYALPQPPATLHTAPNQPENSQETP